jgi:hypothetical protein
MVEENIYTEYLRITLSGCVVINRQSAFIFGQRFRLDRLL